MKEKQILCDVYELVKKKPKFLNEVISAGIQGIMAEIAETRERAVDMEVLAAVGFGLAADKGRVTKNTKEWYESLAKSKLSKHKDNLTNVWKNNDREII